MSCVKQAGCGWCDSAQSCLPGSATSASLGTCAAWFFRQCFTAGEYSKCSYYIAKLDCNARYCNESASYANKGTCQQCKDVEHCYSESNNETTVCSTWNETRCPNGIAAPDYEDERRIENTVFSKSLRLVTPKERTMYYCPDYGDVPHGRMMLAANGRLNVKPGDVVASAQAGGVFHKVYDVTHLNEVTLMSAEAASLLEAFRYADFSSQIPVLLVDDDTAVEQRPPDVLVDDVLSRHAELDSTTNVHTLDPVNAYKCKGRSYLANEGKTATTYHVLLETDNVSYAVEDLLVSQNSSGFLETVLGASSTSVGTMVKTTLTECNNLDTSKLKLSQPRRNTSYIGGDNNPGLLMFDKDITPSVNIGDVVVGRNSFAIFAKVLRVQYIAGIAILEVANVERIENGTAITRLNSDDIKRAPLSKGTPGVSLSGSNVHSLTSGVS